jgi:hypothetical protein
MRKFVVKCWKCGGTGDVPYEDGGHPHVSLRVKCDVCKGSGQVVMEVIGEIVDENPQFVGVDIAADKDYAGKVKVRISPEYRRRVMKDHELDPHMRGRSFCGKNPVILTKGMIANKPKVKR